MAPLTPVGAVSSGSWWSVKGCWRHWLLQGNFLGEGQMLTGCFGHGDAHRECSLPGKTIPDPGVDVIAPLSLSLLSHSGAATAATPINPFQVNQPQPLTLNQMRASPVMGSSPSFSTVPPMSMEPIPLSSMAPVPVGMAPLPAMGTIRMGQGLSIAGSMPQALHSTGMPPAASQAANTTNPFLL